MVWGEGYEPDMLVYSDGQVADFYCWQLWLCPIGHANINSNVYGLLVLKSVL